MSIRRYKKTVYYITSSKLKDIFEDNEVIKILHVSDIHSKIKNLQEIVDDFNPDLILDTGDTIDECTRLEDFQEVINFMENNKDKIVRIDGNHDI